MFDLFVVYFDGVFVNVVLFYVFSVDLLSVLCVLYVMFKLGGVLFSFNLCG